MGLESGSDTVRRDWLIFILGLLAAGWFFFDYGNHHPLAIADASVSKQQIVNQGMGTFNDLGYSLTETDFRASYKIRNNLIDSLQKQVNLRDFFADSVNKRVYRGTYWNLDVFLPASGEDDSFDFEGPGIQAEYNLRYDEEGRWLEFRNPDQRRPLRLLNVEALQSTRTHPSPPSEMMTARDDSLVLEYFSFDLSDDETQIESGSEESAERVILTRSDVLDIARYYLNQSSWPEPLLEFQSMRRVPFDTFEAAELVFGMGVESVRQRLELNMKLSPGGALLGLEASYPSVEDSNQPLQFVLGSIRGFIAVIFFFWLIILFYIRMRLRVIDIHSAIFFAVIAGIFFPGFELLRWLYENIGGPETPGVVDLIMLSIFLSLMAAFISLAFFIVTVTGESLTRQNWGKKIRTLDLIRIGHFVNRPVGVTFIHAVSFGFMLAALWSALQWVFPGVYISVESTFKTDQAYLAPVVHLGTQFLICFIVIQSVYLILIGQLRKFTKNPALMIGLSVLIFGLMAPINTEIGPAGYEIVVSGFIGLGLGVLYMTRDFLTTFLSFFLFTVLLSTADGWVMQNSPDTLVLYPVLGFILLFLVFGYIAVSRGKSVRELPKYVPEYIEELAQEERIKQELQIARKVQQSFLPVKKPNLSGLDLTAVCIPAYETGGDYYDFIRIDEHRVAVIVGDVSGKGFQAAFYMTFIKGVLHALCRDYDSTVTVLNKANELFYENARKGTFISLVFGVLDLKDGRFIFSRAGHNPLLHYRNADNKLDIIRPNGMALGMAQGDVFTRNITEQSIQLKKHDLLVLFTDGIVEAVNPSNDYYGDHRLHHKIYFHQQETSEEIVNQIIKDVYDFSDGAKQHDDMTLLVIKRK
ncbi:MAG: SpoIIE family protein phosphatase [Balneolaceae bacterium]